MEIVRGIKEYKEWKSSLPCETTIGFTPTMGALHQGHLSHFDYLNGKVDRTVASVFVNPTQFAPGEDFEKYPRDLDGDAEKLRKVGFDLLFYPSKEEMYPPTSSTTIHVKGVTDKYEGSIRPTHFDGVTTVVFKLLNIVEPAVMTLGQKDAQQAAVVRRMMIDLNSTTELIIVPTMREEDGLAMSSRNAYLSPEDRIEARSLFQSLLQGKKVFQEGGSDEETLEVMRRMITSRGSIDYCDLIDPLTFETPDQSQGERLAILAVKIGSTRLLDNMIFLR